MIKTIITGGQYIDPTEYNGPDIDYCKNCGCNPKHDDTDVCYECSEEFDEMDTYSYCCDATIDTDINICYDCKDHSETALDLYCREHNFNKKTYKYEYRK